ncbi:putative alpha/beta hydrolase domain-containing protein 11-like [Capsicum annuum]|uniref:uncharacterized protein LOC107845100 n=1 Tax=Capsicum annuum TaxID=4072 RepID=UPI001FB197C8|nr:uncharacterized protein LOC107845100 [Capsicum annuum]KAF3646236.1 putative alpha/beta hydrolase domain-containing protein 11-like [Capsicum annuum]KAF3665608.1 putative alpha/beta hydrolase domain-containing protein 11-like [Capsicum annuum]
MAMSNTLSFSLLPLNPNVQGNSPILLKIHHSTHYQCNIIYGHGIRKLVVRNNNNRTAKVTSSSSDHSVTDDSESSAANVVRKFYDGINNRDLDSVEQLISEDCVYEDLVFPQPFVGRKDILNFFNKFIDSVGPDLQFVIDDISKEDSLAVGVTWHLEWKGRPFPFSKGCSFYRLEVVNGQREIVYGRDSVEPAIKPGEAALVVIRGVAWLLQQFPQLAERL